MKLYQGDCLKGWKTFKCHYCGDLFVLRLNREKFGRGKYCSVKCKNEGIKKKHKKECEYCKKVFHYTNKKRRFCSRECSYGARSVGLVKRVIKKPYNINRDISEWRKKQCIVCGIDYVATKRTQKHCSKECVKITTRKQVSGENNFFYIDGRNKKKKSYRGENWENIRREIYKRDNYVCQECGIKCEGKKNYKNSNNIIQCHHIEKYKINKNNLRENLITLCLKCHLKLQN